MNVKNQKRLAAQILRVGKRRILLDNSKLSEIKEAITKTDLRSLIAAGAVKRKPVKGHSRAHARKILIQKRKGKRKNAGSKKGKKTTFIPRKQAWVMKVRTQRKFIKNLKDKKLISNNNFRDLYSRVKNNRFRNIRLIKSYIEENKLIEKNDLQKKV